MTVHAITTIEKLNKSISEGIIIVKAVSEEQSDNYIYLKIERLKANGESITELIAVIK